MSEVGNGGRERAYRALRESEELHRITLSEISDAVFITDDVGVFTFICPNVNVIFGYAPDEVQALSRIAGLLGESLFDAGELRSRGEIRNIERDVRVKSGDVRHLLIHVKTVSIQGGSTLYTCRDITERSRAQEELRIARLELAHASRLALAGQLVASIAHEVSQPLTIITLTAEAGLRLLDGATARGRSVDLRELLTEIRTGARLAVDVVSRLRSLVRKEPLKRQALDVSELAADTLVLIKGEIRRRQVELHTELTGSLPLIEADRVSLQQVLLNLVMNALDAMGGVAERRLVIGTRRVNGSVEITVSDNGCGIPADHRDKIFDAFHTTKANGIGLGLVIAKSIVEQHGGKIWAENGAGPGATFRLSLPVPTGADSHVA